MYPIKILILKIPVLVAMLTPKVSGGNSGAVFQTDQLLKENGRTYSFL